ncbi:2-hydroxy-6-oxo-6-phenylhexa-2,4-dienoate hydrolase [Ktedonobacter sp. SOSP1-52]|uniref:alpha/beta fold hydrolase n=1 Tax=Ktedonobacter sp. SOSP1-52 TaxID=2778366 RepID=UPI001915C061|nr:alpha/beta hydrolase [Ktedonobacter sp. SOSP1-52]GHO71331.1 2-hydroxy-6-oxo-6-phenylhexa-2,4-dienoate hydrolase [Ktedonobacter sp. SOSP1-52]
MECLVGGVPIYYETSGIGVPIVAIHGNPTDHRAMKGCMEPVFANRPGWQRIYFDLPGMGRTPGSKQIKSTDDILDLVLDFIETILPGQHFLLAGESYGGYLSRGVLLRKFEQVEGMALICPLMVSDVQKRDRPPRTVLVNNPHLLASLDSTDAELFRSIAVVQDRDNWEHFRDEVLPGIRVADTTFLHTISQRYGYSFDVDHLPQPFSKPVVILTGRQDSLVGYRDAWHLLENYPRATFAVLDRAGHNAHNEQHQVFNAILGDWLDRVQEVLQKDGLK